MLEMKITIAAPELAAAINNLAVALADGNNAKPAPKEAVSVVQPTVQPMTQPTRPTVPVNPIPAPAAQPTPVSAAIPVPAPIPTAAPQYTLDMISKAGSALIDAGKMDQLVELLTKFGVASLTELAPDSYGAIANELRALGAVL